MLKIDSPTPDAQVQEPTPVGPEGMRSGNETKSARLLARTRSMVIFFWKFFAGMWLCQSILGAIVVIGWTYRLMQRTALKQWWKACRIQGDPRSFEEFLACDYKTVPHLRWPNWIVRQNAWNEICRSATAGPGAQVRTALRCVFPSLWINAKTGVQGIANTWVLTFPACVLWLFAWYDGWNNSFNKGYEQAVVGPLTGIFGIVLFIAAMFYVPMAQARQAVTGDWRSFFHFRLVWRLARAKWLACLGLASLYSALSVPVMILKTAPAFFPQMNPALIDVPPERVLEILNTYFFWCAALVFPVFLILRIVAARIYASGILAAVQSGAITEEQLGELEWQSLHRLDLLQLRPKSKDHLLVRWMKWASSRAGRFTGYGLLVVVWFSFVAQIYISEFFNYHPREGWLNQPLIQLPWFHYIPPAL